MVRQYPTADGKKNPDQNLVPAPLRFNVIIVPMHEWNLGVVANVLPEARKAPKNDFEIQNRHEQPNPNRKACKG
jgi:hypothetical protein